jgi:hypothetical protein
MDIKNNPQNYKKEFLNDLVEKNKKELISSFKNRKTNHNFNNDVSFARVFYQDNDASVAGFI